MEIKDFDKSTQLKLFLLDKFGITDDLKTIDFCERAYEFLTGDMMVYKGSDEKGNVLVEQALDGVYLIYEQHDGNKINRWYKPFDGTNSKEYAVAVAFKFGQVSLTLYGKNIRDCKMTTENDGDDVNYIKSHAQAAHDFNGKRWTELLIKRNLSCAGKLPIEYPEWYIPAIGELYVMFLMRTYINDALEYIGAEPLENGWYWSSSEYYATSTWIMNFGTCGFYGSRKEIECSVRPVSVFDPLSL